MTRACKTLIDLESTPYYHCISHCVRRAFLYGGDHLTGRSYEHRQPSVIANMTYLSRAFAIDIACFAVMSNHYHLALRFHAGKTKHWSEESVIRCWGKLYRIPQLTKKLSKE